MMSLIRLLKSSDSHNSHRCQFESCPRNPQAERPAICLEFPWENVEMLLGLDFSKPCCLKHSKLAMTSSSTTLDPRFIREHALI